MRALSEQPPAGPNFFEFGVGEGIGEQNFAFSRFLDHAIFAPRTRPWRCSNFVPRIYETMVAS